MRRMGSIGQPAKYSPASELADGAWGLTVATIHQLQVYRHLGRSASSMPISLSDEPGINYVLDELTAVDPEFEFFCLVDTGGLPPRFLLMPFACVDLADRSTCFLR